MGDGTLDMPWGDRGRSQKPHPGPSDSSRTKGPDVKPQTLIKRHGPCSTLLLDDLVAEGLGAAPLPNAGQTEGVTAGGQDTKPAVRRIGLLNHHLHTDGTYLNNRQNIPETQTGGTHHWQKISSG